MTLIFKNPELERGYAAHYISSRAKSDSMGMLLEASLWIAGVSKKKMDFGSNFHVTCRRRPKS